MRIRIHTFQWILVATAIMATSFGNSTTGTVFGGDQVQEVANDEVTLDDIQRLRQQIPTTDEAVKAEVEEILNRAEANLKQTAKNRDLLDGHQLAKNGAAAAAQSLRDSDPSRDLPKVDWRSARLDDLQEMVEDSTSWLEDKKKKASDAAAEIGQRITRRQQIREKLAVIDQSYDELKTRLANTVVDENLTAKANQLEMRSKIEEMESETSLLETELRRLDAEDRVDLSRLKSEYFRNLVELGQAELDEMQKALNTQRTEAAAEAKRQTQLSQLGSNPLLQESFQKNLKLAESNSNATQRIAEIEDRVKEEKVRYAALKERFVDTRNRVRVIGLTGSVGAMLRNEKDKLLDDYRLSLIGQSSEEFDEVQFQLFDVQQQMKDLSDDTIVVEAYQSGQGNTAELESLSDSIAQLVKQREELLTAANTSYTRQLDQLIELEQTDRQLSDLVREYRAFINERILWSKSNDLLFTSLEVDAGDRNVLDSTQWKSVGDVLAVDWKRHPWGYLLIALGVLTLVVLKPRMRKAVDAFGIEAARGSCSQFLPTAKSFLLTTLIAIAIPLVVLFVGWRLFQATRLQENPSELASALGRALLAASGFLIPVEILRRICRESGLGHKHFNWSDESVKTLKVNLTWASPLGGVIVFAVALFYFLDTRHLNDLLERLVFLVGMLSLSYLLYRCFSPKVGIFRNYLRQNERSWANQLRFVWYGILMAIPLTLGVFAVVGYFYTALNLTACVFMTFVFGLIVETIRALLMRFILVRRRHAHIELSKRRRMALKNESRKSDGEKQGELAAAVGSTVVTDAELLEDFNVEKNASHSQKLIALVLLVVWFLGLWMIWTDVLPALRALDRYPVWPPADSFVENVTTGTTILSSEAAAIESSADSTVQDEALTRITIRDVLIFFLISLITFVLARNLPSLIEMTFLKHLPVEPSVRYASKSILSYGIVLLGMVLAFRSIQVGWSQVQWLATALTFGLAFGLQEIFANFVAGIILLFERPIRIGDVVTVDNITGVVTRIRTRATTVSNWDRKEYVIPNREFITGRVLNWTLSDQVNRIVINVGVAYGTDVEKAKRILLSICEEHPKTIDEPATRVTFEQFGDSSLLLIVRTFVPDVDCRLTVIDQLHSEINQAFEDAGIEISFPQMDLHVRSIEGQTPSVGDSGSESGS